MSEKRKTPIETLQLEVKDSLESLECLKVIGASSRHGDLRFMCRVEDKSRWEQALRAYLIMEESDSDWYSFLGTKYFVANGKVVFGWVLLWESDDPAGMVRKVRSLWSRVREDINSARVKNEVLTTGAPWASTYYEDKVSSRAKPTRGS